MLKPIVNASDGIVTDNFQSRVPIEGTDVMSTVLDPFITALSTTVPLPVEVLSPLCGLVTEVVYPGGSASRMGGSWILTPLQVAMNNLLRVISEYDPDNETTVSNIEKSVYNYQSALVNALAGKDGLINRFVITGRSANSGRFVAIASTERGPEWVGVPAAMMDDLGFKEGSYALVARQPILHEKGVEVVRTYPVPHDCIAFHPVLHEDFNLDHDGDQCPVQFVPIAFEDEAAANVLSSYKDKPVKNIPYPVTSEKGEAWESGESLDEIGAEVESGLAPTGISISPEDMISGKVDWYEKASGKELLEDSRKIIDGLNLSEIRERVGHVGFANLCTKRFVGPAGALGTALRVIALASGDNEVLLSAMYINERITQTLMDAKHSVGATDEQGFIKVMDALNLRREFDGASRADISAVLIENGMDEEKIKPFMEYHFLELENFEDEGKGVKDSYANGHDFLASSTGNVQDMDELLHTYRSYSGVDPSYATTPFTAAALRIFKS